MNDGIPGAAGAAAEPGAASSEATGQRERARSPSPSPAGDGTFDPAEDLDALFPDRDVTVRDPDSGQPVTLTVRELRYLESLEVLAGARPLLAAIAASVGDEGEVVKGVLDDALSEHAPAWLAIMARATRRDAAWLARLPARDGDALASALWAANQDFFCRAIVGEMVRRHRSERSSTSSSGPDTAGDTATSPAA